VDEHVESGRIDKINLALAPFSARETCRNGHFPRDFFFVVIGSGRSIVHAAQALRGSGGIQGGGDQGSFACVPMSYNRNIPNVFSCIDLHGISFRGSPKL
jgi:hypothetical protein